MKIKVLHITPGLNICGGIESYIINYYRHIDRDKIQFDFITHDIKTPSYLEEIQRLGGQVFQYPQIGLKNVISLQQKINAFFEKHRDEYQIVHCHMANAACFYLKAAKKYGVPVRILHSHQTQFADKKTHALRNLFLIPFGKYYANEYFACSKAAGDFLYGKVEYKVINNAVEMEKFVFNPQVRSCMRKDLSLNGKFVIGHVGRFTPQKNQSFLIRVFQKIHQINPDSVLLLVGDGDTKTEIQQLVKAYSLDDCVHFLGSRTDVNKLYQAMDAFVLPSLYEGLPVVGVEAQMASLPCFFSDTITQEVKILDTTRFLPINNSDSWAKNIVQYATEKRNMNDIENEHFDINYQANMIERFYLQSVVGK